MARQDPIVVAESVSDAGNMIVDGSTAATGAIDIFEIGGTGGCTIYREFDTTGDGAVDGSVQIDAPSGEFHLQKNQLTVSANEDAQLEISNGSGSSQKYYVMGFEVPDGS